MPSKDHDRNLLFGILAVQMDFITRDALVTAMNAWVLAKEKPLGEILVEQRVLASDRRTLLDALVNEHLKQHDNDPEKSLAAVSSIGSLRNDLRQITDADVQATLAHVCAAHPLADPYATMAHSIGSDTSSGMRFRILRPHAEGGLGMVYVARDGELGRDVALKEIKERHADNLESRARFLLEAEITGGLEHPGIVPVYGLGQYADGRPYYAMRFIRGDSLKEAVDRYHDPKADKSNAGERAVELRKLLGRFLDVCNAVAYAHSRGVLHRDLKPGNIMLGKYGETLVVDWGLAKSVDRPELTSDSTEVLLKPSSSGGPAATQMGSTLGTPQYMSPEQAAGRLDLLGPASDVYSLGATLYYVLTGKPPVASGDIGTILKNVERGEFRPPRAVNPEAARPLDAICLKAMSLNPADRYASPKTLSDDVEHWLADEPVVAHRDSLFARLSRIARRHKVATAAVGALLLAALVSLLIGTVLMGHEQSLTEKARMQAVSAQQAAERLNQRLEITNLDLQNRTDQLQNMTADLRASNTILKSEKEKNLRLLALSFVAYGRVCELAAKIANLDDSLVVVKGREPQVSEQAKLQFRLQYDLLVEAGDPAIKPALDAYWNAIQKWDGSTRSAEVRQLSLQLAHACGEAWRTSMKDSPQLQERIRMYLYKRVCVAADRLAKADKLSSVSHSYTEFWELYWGELAILDSDPVAESMVDFGRDLVAWKKIGNDEPPVELKESMRRKEIALNISCGVADGN